MLFDIMDILLGLALILEGVMSSLYHICPTNANFQFGMYTKCCLKYTY